jgi:hypothetical protein
MRNDSLMEGLLADITVAELAQLADDKPLSY